MLNPTRLRDRPTLRTARPAPMKIHRQGVVNSQPIRIRTNTYGPPHEFMWVHPNLVREEMYGKVTIPPHDFMWTGYLPWKGTFKAWRNLQWLWHQLPKHLRLSAKDVNIPFVKYKGYFSPESLYIHVYHMYRRLLGITDESEFPPIRHLLDKRCYARSTRKAYRVVELICECSQIISHVLHDVELMKS